jgi:hypothetical protein
MARVPARPEGVVPAGLPGEFGEADAAVFGEGSVMKALSWDVKRLNSEADLGRVEGDLSFPIAETPRGNSYARHPA